MTTNPTSITKTTVGRNQPPTVVTRFVTDDLYDLKYFLYRIPDLALLSVWFDDSIIWHEWFARQEPEDRNGLVKVVRNILDQRDSVRIYAFAPGDEPVPKKYLQYAKNYNFSRNSRVLRKKLAVYANSLGKWNG